MNDAAAEPSAPSQAGHQDGPVAQLDRVADFYSAGCRFESCRDRHFIFSLQCFQLLAPLFGSPDWQVSQFLFAFFPLHSPPIEFDSPLRCSVALRRSSSNRTTPSVPVRLLRRARAERRQPFADPAGNNGGNSQGGVSPKYHCFGEFSFDERNLGDLGLRI
jgi:hypothetical protein